MPMVPIVAVVTLAPRVRTDFYTGHDASVQLRYSFLPDLLVRTLLPIFVLSDTDRVLDPGKILASVTESVQLITIRSVVNIDGSSSEQLISTTAQTNTNTMSA